MPIELSEICDATGMSESIIKMQNVSKAKELKMLKDQKHNIYAVDKISIADDCAIVIVRLKNNQNVFYYFKNGRMAYEFKKTLTHAVLNIKV